MNATTTVKPTVNQSAMTWRQFQADNESLTAKELQDSWATVCRERQVEYKARYEAATSGVMFRQLGGIALKGNKKTGVGAGQYRLAAIKAVTATKRELERQRHRDAARVAKREAGYAQLIAEAAE